MLFAVALVLLELTAFSSAKCGGSYDAPNPGNRIVGGYEAGYVQYPWFANIRKKYGDGDPVCGGVLITKRHVLTAAHCFESETPAQDWLEVAFGVYDRCNEDEPGRKVYQIEKAVKHVLFNGVPYNDIAMVTLKKSVSDIELVCMPHTNAQNTSEDGKVMGFGYTVEGGATGEPCELQQADLHKFSPEECQEKTNVAVEYQNDGKIFCVGGVSGEGTCQGDSGGPFVTKASDGSYVVAGVDSAGFGCAEDGYPSLFTNIAAYLDWITEHIEGEGTETAPEDSASRTLSFSDKAVGNGMNEDMYGRDPMTMDSFNGRIIFRRSVDRRLDHTDEEPNSGMTEMANSGDVKNKADGSSQEMEKPESHTHSSGDMTGERLGRSVGSSGGNVATTGERLGRSVASSGGSGAMTGGRLGRSVMH